MRCLGSRHSPYLSARSPHRAARSLRTRQPEGNEPWLRINCMETVVEEGDDFRLEVYKKYDSDWPHPTIRVFWYTFAITADESDYEHLYAERQSSNGYQSEHGRMGRDFHTREDLYPEVDETFRVWMNNSVDDGDDDDGECIITITDDDGVGIHRLEITSVPQELPAGSEDGETVVAYTTGDIIEITAHFTGPVTNEGPRHRRAGRLRRAVHTGRREPQARGDAAWRRHGYHRLRLHGAGR